MKYIYNINKQLNLNIDCHSFVIIRDKLCMRVEFESSRPIIVY